uniref:Uncharacterized protein n=1 Tax=Arundo donax TaxID=35708 RepID=A0A0A9BI07_ARUDO
MYFVHAEVLNPLRIMLNFVCVSKHVANLET